MKKKELLIFLLIAFFNGFCQAKVIRLGLINPVPRNLEKILYLTNNGYIDLDSLEIIGIYHENQNKSIERTREFIAENRYANISISTIKNAIPFDSLFARNKCTNEFEELFLKTDGLIFFGGADISPGLYGEKTFLTTVLIPNEKNWELSFLFHLIGNCQNIDFVPFLEKKPDYLILGICLGMQQMNVAAGGTLYQDIPFQIYKKVDYESVLEQDAEKQHDNYRERVNYLNDKGAILHFHHIRIAPNSTLNFEQIQNPLVVSAHHQSVKKLGKNFQTIATSMDKKVIEAISSTKYRNVYGVQFHPDYSIIYEQQELMNAKNDLILLDADDKLFYKYFWRDFSDRLRKIVI
jgi:putative glutamine amidotransferase